MTAFRVKLQNGQTVKIDAPDAQTAAKVAARYERQQQPGYKAAKKNAKIQDGTNFIQGVLLNHADEIQGGLEAAYTAVGNVGRRMTGQRIPYGAADAYEATRDAFREKQAKESQANPGGAFAEGLVGGVFAPGVKASGQYVAGAKGLVGAMTRSALVGGAYGAVAGSGGADGDAVDRVKGAVGGATAGAMTGAAVPAVVKGVASIPGAARRAGASVSATVEAVRKPPAAARPPTPKATQRAEGYVRDIAAKSHVNADAAVANPAYAAGRPVTGAELIGRQGISQLAAVGRRSGQTGDALESALSERARGMPERVMGEIETAAGMDAATVADDFAAQAAKLREAARPLYDEAYAVGPIDSATLQMLSVRPAMRRAMSRAVRIAEEEGREPTELGFRVVQRGAGTTSRVNPDIAYQDIGGGRYQARVNTVVDDPNFAEGVVQVENPSAQTWDYVKRGLDDILETYRDKTTGKLRLDEEGRAILATLKAMRKELTTLNPAYERALAAGGEPLQLEEAYRLAPRLMGPGVSKRAFLQRFESFSDAQKTALRQGAVNSLYEAVGKGRLKLKDMQTPDFRAKLSALVGEVEADKFLANAKIEMDLAKSGARMAPGTNSPSFELLEASRVQDEALAGAGNVAMGAIRGSPSQALSGVTRLMTAPFRTTARGWQTPIDEMTRDEVGRILMSPEETIRVLRAQPVQPRRMTVSPYLTAPISAYVGGR